MYRINPILTSVIVVAFVVATATIGGHSRAVASRPSARSAVSVSTSTPTAGPATPAVASRPEITASIAPAARGSVPAGDTLLLHVATGATLTLTLAQAAAPKAIAASLPPPKPASRPTRHFHIPSFFEQHPAELPKPPEEAAAPAADVKPAPLPAPTPAPEPTPTPPAVAAVSAMTFNELDGALRAAPTTQSLNQRTTKGNITLRIILAGKVSDRDAVEFAIANSENDPFFISLVKVAFNGNTIQSESVGPYVASPGQEIKAIVHFAAAAAAGKSVTMTIIQSGGSHRQFQISPDHVF